MPLIIANTALSGAAGGLAGLTISWGLRGHSTVGATINGVVAGLVAICAACDIVGEVGAIAIGLGAGALAIAATSALERLRIDDVIGAVPAHLAAGAWGTLSVALFGDPAQLSAGNWLDQLGIQAFGVFVVGLFSMPLSLALFWTINRVMPFRVSADQERIGLNVSEHGATTSLVDLVTQMDRQARTGDFSARVSVEPETEADQVATFYNAVLEKFRDETRRRQEALERLGQLANTDALTGLPNRRVFHEQLRRSLASCRRSGGGGGVLYLDLDGFKDINDGMGHEAGDQVLKEVALRMSCMVREADMLARLGGDEFALLVGGVDSPETAGCVAEKLIEAVEKPFFLRQGEARIGASIGVALFGGAAEHDISDDDVESVIKRADHAMYDAKLAGKGTWCYAAAETVSPRSGCIVA